MPPAGSGWSHLLLLLLLLLPLLLLSLAGSTTWAFVGQACNKTIDCNAVGNHEHCLMPNWFDQPVMWPPCPKHGRCTCEPDHALLSNGTCAHKVNLNFHDKCTFSAHEHYLPMYSCIPNGTQAYIGCNYPYYTETEGTCEPAMVDRGSSWSVWPIVWSTWPQFATIASFLDACSTTGVGCNTSQGLDCQVRGPSSKYSQCLCANASHVFDFDLSLCRPRLYGDVCESTSDCSNLGRAGGYECRLGRCRCAAGFEPHSLRTWNYTERTSALQRVCIELGASVGLPTGAQCSVDPLAADIEDAASLKLCHPNAFCHVCSTGGAVQDDQWGTCRELACLRDSDCSGEAAACNRWAAQFDPPCDNGMCDCQPGSGFYKDRFSRCSPYRELRLGDRCMPAAPLGLHPWFQNNEDWDRSRATCALQSGLPPDVHGWGTLTCRLPYQEDAYGQCRANDKQRFVELDYGDACDDSDVLQRWSCNATKRLVCDATKHLCVCEPAPLRKHDASPIHWVGCNSPYYYESSLIWDGFTCRERTFGDFCETRSDCDGGVCVNHSCQCPFRLVVGEVRLLQRLDNANSVAQLATYPFCFHNVTSVDKGGECHLDPVAWECVFGNDRYRYGHDDEWLLPRLCRPPLVCVRCPSDFRPSDDARGICREFHQLPAREPAVENNDDERCQVRFAEFGASSLLPTPAPNTSNTTCAATTIHAKLSHLALLNSFNVVVIIPRFVSIIATG